MVGCDDLKRIAYFFLDGELGDEEGRAIQSHLDLCPPCHDRVVIHQRIRLFIRHRLMTQPAPQKLRDRIHAAFLNNGGATT